MKIYDQDKMQELNEKDLDMSLGHLVDDKIVTVHHEATEAKDAISAQEQYEKLKAAGEKVKIIDGKYYRVTKTFENTNGENVAQIHDIPAHPATVAHDDYEDIKVYIPYTEEELQKIVDNKRHAELKAELAKIKEDIEQVETFRMVRDDYDEKVLRGAKIIQELQRLEGKEPREIRPNVL